MAFNWSPGGCCCKTGVGEFDIYFVDAGGTVHMPWRSRYSFTLLPSVYARGSTQWFADSWAGQQFEIIAPDPQTGGYISHAPKIWGPQSGDETVWAVEEVRTPQGSLTPVRTNLIVCRDIEAGVELFAKPATDFGGIVDGGATGLLTRHGSYARTGHTDPNTSWSYRCGVADDAIHCFAIQSFNGSGFSLGQVSTTPKISRHLTINQDGTESDTGSVYAWQEVRRNGLAQEYQVLMVECIAARGGNFASGSFRRFWHSNSSPFPAVHTQQIVVGSVGLASPALISETTTPPINQTTINDPALTISGTTIYEATREFDRIVGDPPPSFNFARLSARSLYLDGNAVNFVCAFVYDDFDDRDPTIDGGYRKRVQLNVNGAAALDYPVWIAGGFANNPDVTYAQIDAPLWRTPHAFRGPVQSVIVARKVFVDGTWNDGAGGIRDVNQWQVETPNPWVLSIFQGGSEVWRSRSFVGIPQCEHSSDQYFYVKTDLVPIADMAPNWTAGPQMQQAVLNGRWGAWKISPDGSEVVPMGMLTDTQNQIEPWPNFVGSTGQLTANPLPFGAGYNGVNFEVLRNSDLFAEPEE